MSNYNGINICLLQYSKENELEVKTGNIINLKNKYEIFHSINTDYGSSGSPIICINKNYTVIGIHRSFNINEKLNFGSYIKCILEHINNRYIICEYNITENELNQSIQILNCFEEIKKVYSKVIGINNENEIRNNCEIYINNNKINFEFKNIFSEKGINKINIKCNKNLQNMSAMFYNCYSLTSLNLSNFNTNNINNMSYIFYNCSSLTSLNLSNFNTNNVINMSYMFYNCYNLIPLDLSNFNINNVKYKDHMFTVE